MTWLDWLLTPGAESTRAFFRGGVWAPDPNKQSLTERHAEGKPRK
jgi:hypothetical protein